MPRALPALNYEDLVPTRDYLREVTLVLGSLQRAFLPKHPRQWEHGLEVTMRGLSTQPFMVQGREMRAGLDLVRHKVRLNGNKWALHEYSAPEILNNIKTWLGSRDAKASLDEPEFASGIMLYDTALADAYAAVLWWMDGQFQKLRAELNGGVTSPILLYPHHFDLAFSWFPHDDERQLTIGWSTGDQTVSEPYVYVTVYPEPAGYSMMVLPYAELQTADSPETLLRETVMTSVRSKRL